MSAKILGFPGRPRADDPRREVTVLCALQGVSLQQFARALEAAGFRCSLSENRLLGDQMWVEPRKERR